MKEKEQITMSLSKIIYNEIVRCFITIILFIVLYVCTTHNEQLNLETSGSFPSLK